MVVSSPGDGVVRLLRTRSHGLWVHRFRRQRVLSAFCRKWVETTVRLQGPGLALRPAQQFRGALLISCVGSQKLGAHETWTTRLLSPGTSMLVSAPKTPENEENGAAIRSRRWCDRRPQSGICLHSLVEEVPPAERTTRTWARPMTATRISGHELRWPPQNSYFIRHFFQAERLGRRLWL